MPNSGFSIDTGSFYHLQCPNQSSAIAPLSQSTSNECQSDNRIRPESYSLYEVKGSLHNQFPVYPCSVLLCLRYFQSATGIIPEDLNEIEAFIQQDLAPLVFHTSTETLIYKTPPPSPLPPAPVI
ncbi:hypothetical protein B9Z19DRAFT_1061639 [Tuber borchii]|uniref:Uncharacterized protein n=1 Tax=Tuber borchii TaxID=42251 RepID=A0A2T7A4E3_TUBBO|nr:hypothetical protein B9Z19DRAFT_1061639 [Tuber borchii]